ncbi:HAD family hydrolase [Oscillatoria salina]|uniref:HAD family hydrolase n=1 Tax=Oscillatoria salina TaxID=331517 RepID=UPI0013BCEA48|nr:HAD-IA family hydrolase [Oscillatoria salina]MBZ8179883.1 HAD-IA family hydrolase [Oscillatoria salina IIICB1]NET87430.1 HAD-IA family hydrolase [Kamptonema sp. SIO1D9]
MLAGILLDLDGTLANTDPLHFNIWQNMLREYDLEIDSVFYKKNISGRQNQEIIKDILPQLSVEAGREFALEKERRFRELASSQLQRLAGLDKLLNWIDVSGLKKAVVTNAPRENAEFMLTALALKEVFPIVILGDDLPAGKPDPMPYDRAIALLNLTPDTVVAFEDSPSGIRAAVAAGIYTIGVATTHDRQFLQALGASLVVNDFTDESLWELLDSRL